MDRRYDLILILTMTASVFYGPTATVEGAAPNVHGWKGEVIRLPCDLKEEPLDLVWAKESISPQQGWTTKAIFFDGSIESKETRFDIDKDFSLIITDLEVADEGLYQCQVVQKNFEDVQKSIFMTVSSMASKHTIKECVDQDQSYQSGCTYQTSSSTPFFTLTCVVSGFKTANISMMWIEASGKIINSVVSQKTTLSDGTNERLETITVSAKRGTEQSFRCMAIGDVLNGTSTVEITVLPMSEKHGNLGLIIGLVISVPVALAIICLIVGKCLQNYKPDYLPQKGCGWNPCWRVPHKPEQIDEEELMLGLPHRSSPLTKEQVQQCKEDLKQYYRETRRKVTVDPLKFMERVDLDKIYTNLSLIDRSSLDKTPITYDSLLTNDENEQLSKHLLIQGEGGVGKTTLCAKIAWDWCQARILHGVEMLLVIPLRDVSDDESIGSIVTRYLSESNEATPKQLDEYLLENQSKVLLVFDGFDEFGGKLHGEKNSEIIRILGLQKYKACWVFVTTRPWRTDEFRMDRTLAETYTFISVEGFDEKSLKTYIEKFFQIRKKDALAESLISFMDENDVIRSNMAPFPIFCAMLCLMWNNYNEDKREKMQKLQTFSNILGEMISFLQDHYASKECEHQTGQNPAKYVEKADEAIHCISKIALLGLLNRNLSFPEEQFKECRDAMETCCKVGVLTLERDVISRDRRGDVNIPSFVVSTVSFPHKLFQEYIAGKYIAKLFANDSDEYENVKNKLLPQFQEFRYILYFASALAKKLGLDVIDGLKKCADQNDCVDVAFECHTKDATISVGEQWKDYKLSRDLSEHTISGVVFMALFNQVQSLSIDDVKCGRTVSRDLAKGICSSSDLRKVTMRDSQFHLDFYKILGADASNCKADDLELHVNSSDEKSQHKSSMEEDLARWVCTIPCLARFSLTSNYFLDNFFSTAANSSSSCKIQDLQLSFNFFDEDSQCQVSVGNDMAKWVCAISGLSSFTVKCFFLPDNFFSTATTVAQSCQITDLRLTFDSMDDNSQYQPSVRGDLARWVCALPHLSSFTLTCVYLPDNFLSAIADLARSCKIQDLKLSFDGLGEGFEYQSSLGENLARWVCTMPRLSNFRLECAYLPDDFFSTAAEMMQSCQVRELILQFYNDWTSQEPAAAINLAKVLCGLTNLESAVLHFEKLPRIFFTTASQATRSQLERITLNGKPLNECVSDNQEGTAQKRRDGSS